MLTVDRCLSFFSLPSFFFQLSLFGPRFAICRQDGTCNGYDNSFLTQNFSNLETLLNMFCVKTLGLPKVSSILKIGQGKIPAVDTVDKRK